MGERDKSLVVGRLGAGDGLDGVELLERFFDDVDRLVEVLLGDDEGRGETDAVGRKQASQSPPLHTRTETSKLTY